MDSSQIFNGFFSYAHADRNISSEFFFAFTNRLESIVNARLVNAKFSLWNDVEGLRLADRWNAKIEDKIKSSHVFVVLLSPHWINSPYCRKEYELFRATEQDMGDGWCIAPLLARSLERQIRHFNEDQKNIYVDLESRQYAEIIAAEFVTMNAGDQTRLIEKVADGIEGIIERFRLRPKVMPRKASSLYKRSREFDLAAHNFESRDFLTHGEIVLDRRSSSTQSSLLLHLSFLEKLFVQGTKARIEFGVRRALLNVANKGPGELTQCAELKYSNDARNVYYVQMQDEQGDIAVCIDPLPGKSTLGEAPLPPHRDENYYAKIADVSPSVSADDIIAELFVTMDVEGIHLFNESHVLSARGKASIRAVMEVAQKKQHHSRDKLSIHRGC